MRRDLVLFYAFLEQFAVLLGQFLRSILFRIVSSKNERGQFHELTVEVREVLKAFKVEELI